jgi:hypothetical protein
MKSFTRVAIIGASGVVLFKLFATVLLPMMAFFFGLIALTVKLAVMAAVVFFLWSLVKKKDNSNEVVVE